ncbi:MAG: methionyl-tRNA formyltransferase [Elusimicrobia bacterium RIFOXYB2_FULL_48_7]|nr:MAG: methionyl-tRNA formyltransferase [Elusimicrobia bacterium RIFOXYB2_FULL_48_7]
MNIIFFGSSSTSVKFLEHLLKKENIAGVVTSQDKPSGRGLELHHTPVKQFARENNCPLVELNGLLDSEIKAGLGIAVSFGKILKKEVFSFPEKGTINVHFSLLPKYRGASPMQWAIINGEKTTGVSVFFIDEGLDTGKIILQEEVPVLGDDFIALENRMVSAGIGLLDRAVALIRDGKCVPKEQSGKPTLAPPLKKTDGKINWSSKTAVEICNLIKGTRPWPGAYTEMNVERNRMLKILDARPLEEIAGEQPLANSKAEPGEISGILKGSGFAVGCRGSFLLVEKVQRENKKPVSAWDFLQGARLHGERMKAGDRFII